MGSLFPKFPPLNILLPPLLSHDNSIHKLAQYFIYTNSTYYVIQFDSNVTKMLASVLNVSPRPPSQPSSS